jgi:hypothetical protein
MAEARSSTVSQWRLGSLFIAGRVSTTSRSVWFVPVGLALLVGGLTWVSPWLAHGLIALPLPARIPRRAWHSTAVE